MHLHIVFLGKLHLHIVMNFFCKKYKFSKLTEVIYMDFRFLISCACAPVYCNAYLSQNHMRSLCKLACASYRQETVFRTCAIVN